MMLKNKKVAFLFLVVGLFLICFGVCRYLHCQKEIVDNELGTCKTPEEAFEETQEALNLISKSLNSGIENAQHLKEYDTAKDKVFKKEK